MGAGSVTIQKMKADFPLLYGIWENPHHYYPYGRIKLSIKCNGTPCGMVSAGRAL